MSVKFLDLKNQYESIQIEIDDAIRLVIDQSAYIGGKFVSDFEKAFSHFQQADFCIGVANGTDALEIAIEALAFPKGSEIIVPANTFISSSEAVTRCGHKVVFVDVNSDSYTISLDNVEKRIGPNTRAIIAVHLYGNPCDMDGLNKIAKTFNLKIIEDCAQAHGAKYNGRRLGGIGDISTFSFYPGKNLGAYGDAGAILTNNESLALRCKMIANHGRIDKYNHVLEGRNSRLDGLQAAILNVKLKYLDGWIARRNTIAERNISELSDIKEIILPKKMPNVCHAFHLFVIRTPYRDALQKHLNQQEIETGIHYPIALPKLEAYSYLNQHTDFPNACTFDDQLLSLPIGEHITDIGVDEVISSIHSFFSI